MTIFKKTPWITVLILMCTFPSVYSEVDYNKHNIKEPTRLHQAPIPQVRQEIPPSLQQSKFNLPPTLKQRFDLLDHRASQKEKELIASDCNNMNKLASYKGEALANYIVNLPDFECHYDLFSLASLQATQIYSPENFSAIATRFVNEANTYNASNMALINLLIYLRAGYYLANYNAIEHPSLSLTEILRPGIKKLVDGHTLFKSNLVAPNTASETLNLIINMQDEAYYLTSMKNIVLGYTNNKNNPNAANALRQPSAASGFTGVLRVFFYAHNRNEGKFLLQKDTSYPEALNNFVINNRNSLSGTEIAYQLSDTANEVFRFLQYPAQKPSVKIITKNLLATTSMTGMDRDLWLAAAMGVKYNDNANCAEYNTCGFETRLADSLLKNKYTCSQTIKIKAQDMTLEQMQSSCNLLRTEESYFHDMLQTNHTPVANDHNTSLEVVVFDDYTSYSKYAAAIYSINTNNGGMYLEPGLDDIDQQARFIAHEASWMRPVFQVWNLKHEYIHYLDGRFNMFGDFKLSTAKPTVWWIEGIAEYLSKKNDNSEAINIARTGRYRLSQIFGNTYSMTDYTERAYPWGYMAIRFMFERHRNDVDNIIAKFRVGDYGSYKNTIDYIGTRYDSEFAKWVMSADTISEPTQPSSLLPPKTLLQTGLAK